MDSRVLCGSGMRHMSYGDKYVHVYLQEIVEELMDECNVGNVGISEKVGNAETIGTSLIDRDVETDRTNFSETVRNAETVRTFFSESDDEDVNYVASESEHSGSPFEDNDNDIVDDNDVEEDDEVCDVLVGVGRDISEFIIASNEGTDEETNSEAETESLHSASDSEREGKRRRFPEFNSEVDIENPQFKKGLVESVLEIFPNGEHRTYVRHLYSNFKSKPENQGKTLKDCLWKVARATYMKEWIDAVNEMKAMSEPSFNWLQPKDPRQWSKSHFSRRCKSDILLNNLSESFNKMILESRDKPILTMIEMIRSKLMTRIVAKKEVVEKIIGTLCPKI
ncbi:hypothetical protein GQ457_06G021110 [Hibiscus cannabinus]